MKRFSLIFALILFLVPFYGQTVPAVPEVEMARIQKNAVLYFDAALSKPVTSLPETHYVALLEKTETRCRVGYLDLEGYMKPQDLQAVDYKPLVEGRLGKINLKSTFDGAYVNIRSTPDLTSANISGTFTFETDAEYYGSVNGEWYLIKFNDGITVKNGYVRAEYFTAAPIVQNNGEMVMVEFSDGDGNDGDTGAAVNADGTLQSALFIAALSLPAIAIMILIFKKPKRQSDKRPRNI